MGSDFTSNAKRPLVAVGYGPRCVPVMQLTEAAGTICDLLWLIDGSIPEMQQMTDLLNRFGPVVDISGLDADRILEEFASPYQPDGIVTYLDANMSTFAKVAAALQRPFHSVETAVALTDKYQQRRVLGNAGLPMPACLIVGPEQSERDLAPIEPHVGWPAVLKPRSAQGSRGMVGRTTSSAAVMALFTSTPVGTPRRSNTATRISVGEFPAPAPSAHRAPSTWRAPAWNASTELATPKDRFWCPWKPT